MSPKKIHNYQSSTRPLTIKELRNRPKAPQTAAELSLQARAEKRQISTSTQQDNPPLFDTTVGGKIAGDLFTQQTYTPKSASSNETEAHIFHQSPPYKTNQYEQIVQVMANNTNTALKLSKSLINSQPANAFNIYSNLIHIGSNLDNLDFINKLKDWYILETNFPTGNQYIANPNPNDESNVPHYASCNFTSGMIDLSTNFNRMNIEYILTPGFIHMSEIQKKSLVCIAPFVGKVFDQNGNPISACLLINKNHVMLPAHCAKNLVGGAIWFPDQTSDSYIKCNVESIIGESEHTDMAIVKLNIEIDLNFDSLHFGSTVLPGEKLFLLHYPEDGLQVSGNVCQLQTHDDYSLVTSHDTSPGSSGGIYFNEFGEIVGIHIGAETNTAMYGNQKYVYLITDLRCNIAPKSRLYDFLLPEGRQSRPELMGLLKQVVDGTITVPAHIKIGIKEINILKSWCKKSTYQYTLITHMQKHCQEADTDQIKMLILWLVKNKSNFLGQANKYGIVFSNWGVGYAVECDHLLPKFILTSTKNKIVKSYGVRGLPAIAIEYRKHRNLKTTDSDTTFSLKLAKLCDQHKIPHALKEVLKDYKDNQLLTTPYKAGLLKLFNTPGEYYDDMVEKDIKASKMSDKDAKECRAVMKECIKMINKI